MVEQTRPKILQPLDLCTELYSVQQKHGPVIEQPHALNSFRENLSTYAEQAVCCWSCWVYHKIWKSFNNKPGKLIYSLFSSTGEAAVFETSMIQDPTQDKMGNPRLTKVTTCLYALILNFPLIPQHWLTAKTLNRSLSQRLLNLHEHNINSWRSL